MTRMYLVCSIYTSDAKAPEIDSQRYTFLTGRMFLPAFLSIPVVFESPIWHSRFYDRTPGLSGLHAKPGLRSPGIPRQSLPSLHIRTFGIPLDIRCICSSIVIKHGPFPAAASSRSPPALHRTPPPLPTPTPTLLSGLLPLFHRWRLLQARPRVFQIRKPAIGPAAAATFLHEGGAVGGEVDDWSGGVLCRVEELLFPLVEVLARIRGLVFEHLDEFVEARGEEGAEDGSEPVDLGWEVSALFLYWGGA